MKIKKIIAGIWRNKYKAIGLVFLCLILRKVNFAQLDAYFNSINPFYILLTFLLSIPAILSRSRRWQILVNQQSHMKLPYAILVRYYLIALFWGAVTPGKIGEFSKIKFLKDHHFSVSRAVAITFVDRFFDMLCLTILGVFGFILYAIKTELTFHQSTLPIFLVMLSFLLIVISGKFWLKWIDQFFSKFLLKFNRHTEEYVMFKKQLSGYQHSVLVESFGWTLLAWIINVFQRYCFARMIGMNINIFYFSSVIVIAAFITLVPISIQGVGTRDTVFVLMFGKLGVPNEQSVIVSSLILTALLFNALMGFITYLFYKHPSINIPEHEHANQ